MSQDAIGKIIEAEEQAQVLCRVATERAAEMRAEMKRQGEAHLAQVERETALEYEKTLKQMCEDADRLREKKREQAQAQAKGIKDAAEERMEQAVKMIVWGIVENVSK